MEASDRQLLSRYIAGRDETAFRALVMRHLPLVHGVARRVTANEDLARDVAQTTFIRLAERAAMIPPNLPLPVWLHRICRHLAIDLVRSEERRKKREQLAPSAMNEPQEPGWSALAPLVDQLVNELPEAERQVLLLRYFCDQGHASIAGQLGVSEVVARKRASRALERLRGALAKRGIVTTAAALAAGLPAHAAPSPPAALAAGVFEATRGIAPLAPSPFHAALIAMNATQKASIAAASLIFLMSASYSVIASGRDAREDTSSNGAIPSFTVEGAGASERSRREARLPSSTAGRLERLKEILEIESHARRYRELTSFIDRLRPDQFAEAARLLGDRNKDRYTSINEYHLFLAAWTKVDVHAALEHVKAGDNMYHLGRVLESWAEQDPDAALAWAEANPVGRESNVCLGYVLSGIAATDVKKAVGLIEKIPNQARRIETLLDLWANFQEQADAMERLLPEIDETALRERLVERGVMMVAHSYPPAAVDLLLKHPTVGGPNRVAEVYQRWAQQMPDGAILGLKKLHPGAIREQSVMQVCFTVAMKDPAKAFRVLERYPETATEEGVAKLATVAVLEDPPGMLGRIMAIQDKRLREETLPVALHQWQEQNKEAAAEWMDRNPIPESVQQKLREMPSENTNLDPFGI
jgi:RNA polymerase sigma factor (sigma-70 family)